MEFGRGPWRDEFVRRMARCFSWCLVERITDPWKEVMMKGGLVNDKGGDF